MRPVYRVARRRALPARRSVKHARGRGPGHVEFSQEAEMNTYTTVPSGEQVVQELPWRWKVQGRIFLIGGLGFMFDAWDVTLNGILIPLLSKHWSLQPGRCRLDRHGEPDRHGPGRLRLGHHRGHHRAQEGLHRHPADLLASSPCSAPSPPTSSGSACSGSWPASAWAAASRWTTRWWASSRPASSAAGSSPRWTAGGRSARPSAASSPPGWLRPSRTGG